jgi:hypothetical protein
VWLYLINTALLATHEIDSGYWHEWELFHLPGGINFFLVLNFLLLLVVIYGFGRVALLARGARGFSYLLAGAGIFAFVVHMGFIFAGRAEFRTPVSIALSLATLLISIAQITVVARFWPQDSSTSPTERSTTADGIRI